VSIGTAGLTIKGTGTTSKVEVSGTSTVVFAVGSAASTTTIEDLAITGGSDGVYSNQGASNLTVSDNAFTTVFSTGAAVNSYGPSPSSGSPVSGVTITGNHMTGPGAGVALFNTKAAVVNDNTIEHSTGGNTGLYLGGSDTTVTITGNHFATDDTAIYVSVFTPTLAVNKATAVHANYFDTTDDFSSTSGTTYGAVVVTSATSAGYTGTLDATGNWWGAASGPGPVGPGTGAGVSSGVDYATWCSNSSCTSSSSSPPPATTPTTPPPAPTGSTSSASGSSSSPTGSATATNDNTTVTATGVGALTVAEYPTDPVGAPSFSSSGEYFDVALSRRSTFRKVVLSVGHTDGGDLLSW
jgi:hypothetical protein